MWFDARDDFLHENLTIVEGARKRVAQRSSG